MNINSKLFGTNGIRFIPGDDYDLEFVLNIGLSIGTFFRGADIVIGYDGRRSSPSLVNAISAGLMEAGKNVFAAGMVPTPALQLITQNSNFDGGIVITASHNPPQYNGVKVISTDGIELSRKDESLIEEIYFNHKYNRKNWNDVGQIHTYSSALDNYIDSIINNVDSTLIKNRKLKIVIDSGNGTQSLSAPLLTELLGCNVITLNSHIDGNFSGRGGEPTPKTLDLLSKSVIEYDADLGVGYDGDGDRSIFCDENGNVFWGDKSGTLIAQHLINKGMNSPIVTTIATSQIIDYVALDNHVDVHRTKVGSVDVSHKMKELDSIFGFEENGGCLYSPHIAVRDGGMATALMLEMLSSSEKSLSEHIEMLPKFYQLKTKFSCPVESRASIIDGISSVLTEKIDTTDGLKIWWDDSSWSLIRPSGTEPIIRLFSESNNESQLESVTKRCSTLIEDLIKNL